MDEMNRTELNGSAIIIGAVAIGLAAIGIAYKARALDRVKFSMAQGIRTTDLDDFDKGDQGKVRKLARKSLKKINKAKSKEKAMAARESFDRAVGEIGTSARKLADEKMNALGDVYGYAMEKYGYPGGAKAKEVVEKYAAAIADAGSREHVLELRKEFLSRINSIMRRG